MDNTQQLDIETVLQIDTDLAEGFEAPDTFKAPDNMRIFDFEGIPVPYWPPSQYTVVDETGQALAKDLEATYVQNLKQFMATGSQTALDNAIMSLEKEILLSLTRAMSFKVPGWEAPVAVSNAVGIEEVYADYVGGRIILNEWLGDERYFDADGDRGTLIFSDDGKQAVFVKFPITSKPPILRVIPQDMYPMENYYPFTLKDAKRECKETPIKRLGENVDEYELFLKKHKDAKVGLLTNAWNCFDLYCSRVRVLGQDPTGADITEKLTFEEKMNYIFSSFIDPLTGKTQRAIDIEDGAMKAARHDQDFIEADVLEFGASKALHHKHAWGLTSASTIGSMKDFQLDWVPEADFDKITHDILNLNVSFRDVKPSVKAREYLKVAHPVAPNEHGLPFDDRGLYDRLKFLGLVKHQDLPKVDPNLPPSCIFWLSLPDGTPIALTDVKRDGREEGLTYAFTLGPVWDNVDLYNEDGTIAIPATHKWMHPINHMQKLMFCFDSAIKPYAGFQGVSYFWPRNHEDWMDKKRSIKVGMLYKWMMEYCGKFGDPAPATKKFKQVIPSKMSMATIQRTAVIDYGREMTDEEMYPIAKRAQETANICIVGSKSTSRRIRKYMHANQWGGSCLDREGIASPHRSAMGRSQLHRALKPCTMTVAILKSNTRKQVGITPSGIEKQRTEEAFLPQVFNTEADYKKHLANHNLNDTDCPAVVVDYHTWQNEHRRCWTIGARNTINIGKLVDELGNKFMPRWVPQMVTLDYETMTATEVDIIMPPEELIDKDAHHAFLFPSLLKHAVEQDVVLPDGKTVTAMVLTKIFWRTGAASENIPPRFRKCSFKGIDSFPIWWQLSKIKKLGERKCDTRVAKMLQSALISILQRTNIETATPTEDENLRMDLSALSINAQSPLE